MIVSTTVARVAMTVLAGFISWLFALIVGEQILSLLMPVQFGAPQSAFQDAIEKGSEFTPQTLHLTLHVLVGIVASLLAGIVTAVIGRDHKRSSYILGWLLLFLGVFKAVVTWQLVPVWYHIAFTGLLFPATIIGSSLHRHAPPSPAPPSPAA